MKLGAFSPSLQENAGGVRIHHPMISRSFRSRRQLICAHATEVITPMLRFTSRCWTGPATSPEKWRKGLLIGANHIGDILYRSSSLKQLAKGFPQCTWDILAPEPAAQVLEGNPAIGTIHRMEIPGAGSQDFEALKREKYDVAICYDSGSYARALVTAAMLGIPSRVGYVHKGLSGLITHPLPINYPQPYPAYFRDLVARLTHCEPDWDLRPAVFPGPGDEAAAQSLWDEFDNGENLPSVACFVTTRQPTAMWSPDQFADALRSLRSLRPARIILCGSQEDKGILETTGQKLGGPCSMNAGRINLRALVSFLRKCDAVLTTDSGPRHLANAAGVPVVYLRNLLSLETETGSYLASEHDLVPPAENPGNLRHKNFASPEITPGMAARRIAELLPN